MPKLWVGSLFIGYKSHPFILRRTIPIGSPLWRCRTSSFYRSSAVYSCCYYPVSSDKKGKNVKPNTPLYIQPLDFRPSSFNCLGALRDCAVVGAPGPGSILTLVISGFSWLLVPTLLREVFYGFFGFSPSPLHKFQFDQDRGLEWKTVKADLTSSINTVTYLFYLWAACDDDKLLAACIPLARVCVHVC